MQQHFKVYKPIDTASAGKILFRLQDNEMIQSIKVCAATGELTIEADKPLAAAQLKNWLDTMPDLIIIEMLGE